MCDISYVLYYQNDRQSPSFKIFESQIADKENYSFLDVYNEFSIDVYLLLDNPDSKMIAFDWDNTVGEDIPFYSKLMDVYIENGFTPIICSLRSPAKENLREFHQKLKRKDIAIYLTNGISKQKYMKMFGYHVNLWVDDFFPGICRYDNPLLEKNKIDYGHL
jgi:hypothetical protein